MGIVRGGRQAERHIADITVSGGSGSGTFQAYGQNVKFNNDLMQIIITPTTSSTSYKFTLTDEDGRVILDGTRVAQTGRYGKGGLGGVAFLYGTITANILNCSADEDIEVAIYVS